ncbi:hypothetical protein [Variovorax sp. RA8]|uniref:hypothetical protein n=1 Tax=Variovorax sp. (strain JCM 16519 / RA8) TaxID=662548 RepID=UPI000ABF818E|nr:hypothetical protein [Variovorax sp. RA8]VTU44684.1 hypothetical protein RA8P2_00218 [Variovorax sp. RA8]
MSFSSPARWLAALPALVALTAIAQTAPAPSEPPPTQPPTLPYRSAFEGYRSYAEEKAIPWKEANDTVHLRGGWRAYAKEVSEATSPVDGPPAKAASDPHAGHAMPAKKEQP